MTEYQNGPGVDDKLSLKTGSGVKYFLQDHLGSTVGLADAAGTVAAAQSYDAFGNGADAAFPTRYQFTGRELDRFTGLQYSRARWYHPAIGRFISEDPIGFAGGDINLYVRSAILNSVSGLRFCDIVRGFEGRGADAACPGIRYEFGAG